MSKIWVTNESSSFAKSFSNWCSITNKHQFVNSLENDEYDYFRQDNYFRSKEIDIFDPTLSTMISRSGAEIIIHQLPITPERSLTHPDYALRCNIEGSYYIIQAAKEIGIPIFFITTKNYNNKTNNVYDITADTVGRLLNTFNAEHVTIVPPIIYGPQLDESISGLIKTALNQKEFIQLNIDPEIQHAYMYIDDFFNALDIVINKSFDGEYDKITQSIVEILPPLDKYIYLEDIFQILEDENYCLSYEIKPKYDKQTEKQNVEWNISTLYNWNEKFNIKTGIKDFISKAKNE